MPDQLLVSVAEAARILGISTARARRMVTSNTMPGLVVLSPRSQRVSVRALEEWVVQEAGAGHRADPGGDAP
jgi:hypothetical protein